MRFRARSGLRLCALALVAMPIAKAQSPAMVGPGGQPVYTGQPGYTGSRRITVSRRTRPAGVQRSAGL